MIQTTNRLSERMWIELCVWYYAFVFNLNEEKKSTKNKIQNMNWLIGGIFSAWRQHKSNIYKTLCKTWE